MGVFNHIDGDGTNSFIVLKTLCFLEITFVVDFLKTTQVMVGSVISSSAFAKNLGP